MDGLITGKHAQNYEKNAVRYGMQYKANTFLSRIIPKHAIVADFCSGTGLGIEFVIKKASKVYGIEASKDMLEIAIQKFKGNPKVILFNSSVQATPLKDSSVDVVLIRMGIHHIKDKKAVLLEASRVLKPKGLLIVMDHFSYTSNRFLNYFHDLSRDWKRWKVFLGHHYCTINQFKKLSQNYFTISSLDITHPGIQSKANIVLQKKKV